MSQSPPRDISWILRDLADGRASAADELLPLVYEQLRDIASGLFRHQPANHTLQPTALVHEAYLRLVKPSEGEGARFNDRAHFLAVAAKAMRQILANHARDRGRVKRGGGWHRVTLTNVAASAASEFDLVLVDDMLNRLCDLDPDQGAIVEMRFFGDMTMEEIARVLGRSLSTVEREWRMARAWIAGQLQADHGLRGTSPTT